MPSLLRIMLKQQEESSRTFHRLHGSMHRQCHLLPHGGAGHCSLRTTSARFRVVAPNSNRRHRFPRAMYRQREEARCGGIRHRIPRTTRNSTMPHEILQSLLPGTLLGKFKVVSMHSSLTPRAMAIASNALPCCHNRGCRAPRLRRLLGKVLVFLWPKNLNWAFFRRRLSPRCQQEP